MDTTWTRFWKKVSVVPGGCWLWTASLYPNGYGCFHLSSRPRRSALAHRWCYEQVMGPVPAGLDLDHVCRVRRCVNPGHLEPVTRSENLLRSPLMGQAARDRTHCKRGHELAGDNLYIHKGHRHCLACKAAAKRSARAAADPEELARRRAADAEYARRSRRKKAGGDVGPVNGEKTHCPQGHPYDGENLFIQGGARRCRTCVREANRRAYEKRKAKAPQEAPTP